ncbi:MAG: exosortase H [Phycisphaerae bacterium]|nr:exosortase H [Phycisphaerae bacterium]
MRRVQKKRQNHNRVAASAPEKRSGRGMKSDPPRATGRPSGQFAVLAFVLIFGILTSLFYAVTLFSTSYREQFFPLVLRLTARLSGAALGLFGQDITVNGTLISSPGFSVCIVRGCDAVEPMALFVCAVLAFPSPLLTKLPGIIGGMLVLAVLNFVRIVCLFLIGVHMRSIFGVMHMDVWQGAFIVMALVLWLLWLTWANRRQMPPARAST